MWRDWLPAARLEGDTTSVAASIVPSALISRMIPDLVRFCLEHGMFPLIGELEDAGASPRTTRGDGSTPRAIGGNARACIGHSGRGLQHPDVFRR